MSSNKSAKSKLMQLYGKECFIDKLHLRPDDGRYTGNGQYAKMQQLTHAQKVKRLTYHHIIPKSKGGKATVENGALLSEENHQWFNQQPPEIQEQLNAMFQEYKRQMDQNRFLEMARQRQEWLEKRKEKRKEKEKGEKEER